MLRRLVEGWVGFAILWTNACALFLVVNLLLYAVQRCGSDQPSLGPIREMIARAHPHLDAGTVDVLVRESERALAYAAYVDVTDPPVSGRFVNVDPAGFRRMPGQGPWPPDAAAWNVFVFGGSTTFGYGVADADTVPAHLQPLLRAPDGRPVHVYNFGHSGYYSTQERILFEQLLVAGHRPDVAVFIDGLNDFAAVGDRPVAAARLASALRPDTETPFAAAVRAIPLTTTVLHAGRILGLTTPDVVEDAEERPAYDDAGYLQGVLARWRRTKRIIESVAAAWNVRTLFVWQPVPSWRFPPGDRGEWPMGGAFGWTRHGYPLMQSSLATDPPGANFVWCADVAADGDPTFYVDVVHYAPVLADRVARCIAAGLQAPAGGPPPPAR